MVPKESITSQFFIFGFRRIHSREPFVCSVYFSFAKVFHDQNVCAARHQRVPRPNRCQTHFIIRRQRVARPNRFNNSPSTCFTNKQFPQLVSATHLPRDSRETQCTQFPYLYLYLNLYLHLTLTVTFIFTFTFTTTATATPPLPLPSPSPSTFRITLPFPLLFLYL